MPSPTDAEITETADATAERDDLVAEVREHAGTIARQLALLDGGDYGKQSFDTDAGEWTVKYEGGDLEYLRYDPGSGDDVYVVSTKQPPAPDSLAEAMADYGAFVEAYNAHVEGLDGVLDDVDVEFPEVATTEAIVADRDRLLARVREAATAMAGELHRYDGGNYGSYSARVDGTRWELKWEDGRPSYLRVGGEGGVYLLSQYGPPSAADVRRYAADVGGFVAAYNEHVEDLAADLSQVSLE